MILVDRWALAASEQLAGTAVRSDVRRACLELIARLVAEYRKGQAINHLPRDAASLALPGPPDGPPIDQRAYARFSAAIGYATASCKPETRELLWAHAGRRMGLIGAFAIGFALAKASEQASFALARASEEASFTRPSPRLEGEGNEASPSRSPLSHGPSQNPKSKIQNSPEVP